MEDRQSEPGAALAGEDLWGEVRAQRALKKALCLDPTLADAHFLKAKIRTDGPVPSRIRDSAARDLDRAISLDGGNPECFALRAELRARPYHPFWKQALADYNRAHELQRLARTPRTKANRGGRVLIFSAAAWPPPPSRAPLSPRSQERSSRSADLPRHSPARRRCMLDCQTPSQVCPGQDLGQT